MEFGQDLLSRVCPHGWVGGLSAGLAEGGVPFLHGAEFDSVGLLGWKSGNEALTLASEERSMMRG